jgi:hypothetical protein
MQLMRWCYKAEATLEKYSINYKNRHVLKKKFSSKLEINLANITMQVISFLVNNKLKTIKVETNYSMLT